MCLFPNVWRLSALPAISAWSRDLPYEKRNLFLQSLFAQLQLSGTVTIDAAIQRALTGLQHR